MFKKKWFKENDMTNNVIMFKENDKTEKMW